MKWNNDLKQFKMVLIFFSSRNWSLKSTHLLENDSLEDDDEEDDVPLSRLVTEDDNENIPLIKLVDHTTNHEKSTLQIQCHPVSPNTVIPDIPTGSRLQESAKQLTTLSSASGDTSDLTEPIAPCAGPSLVSLDNITISRNPCIPLTQKHPIQHHSLLMEHLENKSRKAKPQRWAPPKESRLNTEIEVTHTSLKRPVSMSPVGR